MTLSRQGRLTVLTTILAIAFAAVVGPANAGGGKDLAEGNGTTPDPNASGTDFRFAFNAIGDTTSAKGTLRLKNPSTGTQVRGEVICLQTEGPQRAVIAGRITSISGPAPYGAPNVEEGDAFLLFAEDNGKNRSESDRLAVFLFLGEPPTTELCDADQSGPAPITSGHITIRDR
ncbi:MAG TPA: hypothetical protein VF517_14590 [Thermoleophilaceae bacterium]|jgi:hypothetical protein